jgi:hypothetical protein
MGEPMSGPGADVAGVGPAATQMWKKGAGLQRLHEGLRLSFLLDVPRMVLPPTRTTGNRSNTRSPKGLAMTAQRPV